MPKAPRRGYVPGKPHDSHGLPGYHRLTHARSVKYALWQWIVVLAWEIVT
jgi:hypothetical protein